jgi:hypothetical protein
VNTDNTDFGPAFGLAWFPNTRSGLVGRLFGDGKTVWRRVIPDQLRQRSSTQSFGFELSQSTVLDVAYVGSESHNMWS